MEGKGTWPPLSLLLMRVAFLCTISISDFVCSWVYNLLLGSTSFFLLPLTREASRALPIYWIETPTAQFVFLGAWVVWCTPPTQWRGYDSASQEMLVCLCYHSTLTVKPLPQFSTDINCAAAYRAKTDENCTHGVMARLFHHFAELNTPRIRFV